MGELPVLAAHCWAASADVSLDHRWHEKPPPRTVICYCSPVSGAAEVAKCAPSICFSRNPSLRAHAKRELQHELSRAGGGERWLKFNVFLDAYFHSFQSIFLWHFQRACLGE